MNQEPPPLPKQKKPWTFGRIVKWVLLIPVIIIFSVIVLGVLFGVEPDNSAPTPSASVNDPTDPVDPAELPEPEEPPAPRSTWEMINFVDDFGARTGRQGASSQQVRSVERMGFPYHNHRARFMVDCDSAWIRFTDSPNLTNVDYVNGQSHYQIRVRLDGGTDTHTWTVSQPSVASNDLNFVSDSQAISALSSASKIMIAFPWYGERNAVFEWDLTGSTDAIRKSCESRQ